MQLRQHTTRPTQAQVRPPGTAAQSPQHSIATPPTPRSHSKKSLNKKIALIATLLVVAAVAGWLVWQQLASQIMADRYQAVFLNNGQVYFGKLHDYYGSRPYMTDVYYFQANGQDGGSQQSGGTQLLVKLGKEIHAPEDKLILNKDAILFVENLQDSGNVVDAINKDTQQPGATTQATRGITR
jgi:hypothetical protein